MQTSDSIYCAFRNTAEQRPHKTAIIFQDKKYTFSDLHEMVEKVAAYLLHKGVQKHEKVIIYLPHMPEWVITWLSLQKLGAVAVPVTHFYGHAELGYIAADSGTETIFCAKNNLAEVMTASHKNCFKRIIVVDHGSTEPVNTNHTGPTEIISFEQMLQHNLSPALPVEVEAWEMAEMLYTGGTTGFPKGVPISNILFLEAIDVSRKAIEPLIPRGEAVVIQGAPLNHILGQDFGIGGLLAGDTLILLPKLDLEDVFAQFEKYRATTFFGTPTLCRMVLEHPKLNNYNLNSIKYVFTAGEALPGEVARKWKDKFGVPLYNGYGATETCGSVTSIPTGVPFPEGTSGKVVPTKTVMILNPETMEPVSANRPGELLVASENMVKGYWNKPEETAAHFVLLEGKIWYKTGDVVRMDEAGWLFFVDRSVDLIKHKGYRVAATKVEATLYKHEAVSECCVIGVPDPKVGETVKALVVLKADYKDLSAEELIRHCGERLASYEIPALVEFRTSLPKSPVGKILKRMVRDEERLKLANQKD